MQQFTEWVKLRVKNSHELKKVVNHAHVVRVNLPECLEVAYAHVFTHLEETGSK